MTVGPSGCCQNFFHFFLFAGNLSWFHCLSATANNLVAWSYPHSRRTSLCRLSSWSLKTWCLQKLMACRGNKCLSNILCVWAQIFNRFCRAIFRLSTTKWWTKDYNSFLTMELYVLHVHMWRWQGYDRIALVQVSCRTYPTILVLDNLYIQHREFLVMYPLLFWSHFQSFRRRDMLLIRSVKAWGRQSHIVSWLTLKWDIHRNASWLRIWELRANLVAEIALFGRI